jgi:hypothetical protein
VSVADWRDRFKKYDPRQRLETPPGTGDVHTQYGFRWGPFEVQRLMSVPRPPGSARVISLVTDAGHLLECYVSARGRSVRVWLDHRELKLPAVDGRVRCKPEEWICSVCDSGNSLFKGRWVHICGDQPSDLGGGGG